MSTKPKCVSPALAFLLLALAVGAHAAVRSPERTQGLVTQVPLGTHELVSLTGKGKFVSAQITKQGGISDLTFVSLDIDGRNVVNISIAALQNFGLTEANPYGLVLLEAPEDLKTLTIGYFEPLIFKKQLTLSVNVQQNGVAQIVANVVHGR